MIFCFASWSRDISERFLFLLLRSSGKQQRTRAEICRKNRVTFRSDDWPAFGTHNDWLRHGIASFDDWPVWSQDNLRRGIAPCHLLMKAILDSGKFDEASVDVVFEAGVKVPIRARALQEYTKNYLNPDEDFEEDSDFEGTYILETSLKS